MFCTPVYMLQSVKSVNQALHPISKQYSVAANSSLGIADSA